MEAHSDEIPVKNLIRSSLPCRTYVIHAGTVISTKQPYRVVVTLFDTARPAGGSGVDPFLLPRALPAGVAVRLSNKGSVIAEEMRECYPDTTVSVSFKVGNSFHSWGNQIKGMNNAVTDSSFELSPPPCISPRQQLFQAP